MNANDHEHDSVLKMFKLPYNNLIQAGAMGHSVTERQTFRCFLPNYTAY